MPSRTLRVHNFEPDPPHRLTAAIEASDLPGWWMHADFEQQNGAWVVRSLTVSPAPNGPTPTGGVTQSVLRRIAPSELAPALAGLRRVKGGAAMDLFYGEGTARSMRRRRPPVSGRSEQGLAEWAQRYVEVLPSAKGRPIAALAEQFNYSTTHVRDVIARARREGFLTPTPRGRAGGELTDKARMLLEDTK